MLDPFDPSKIQMSDVDLFKSDIGHTIPLIKKQLTEVFNGKRILIIASAPNAPLPDSNAYDLAVTVNGAAHIARINNIHNSLSLINGFTAKNSGLVSQESLKIIHGCSTDLLLYIDVGISAEQGLSNLEKANFTYKKIIQLSAIERAYIIGETVNYEIAVGERDNRVSSGIFLATLMIWAGAKSLILSGFSLSGGHSYINEKTPREHIHGDRQWFKCIKKYSTCVTTSNLNLAFENAIDYTSGNIKKDKFINACNNLIAPTVLHSKNNSKIGQDLKNKKIMTDSNPIEITGRVFSGVLPYILSFSNKEFFEEKLIDVSNDESLNNLNFKKSSTLLIDASFLALALVRTPKNLWGGLVETTKQKLIATIKQCRTANPNFNNELLFSAMIEAFLFMAGEDYDKMRVDYALRQHEQWYLGDGHYSDGPHFHADYYNSYVILPFLLQITQTLKGQMKDWDNMGIKILERAKRYAEVQERMISPDGTFPPIGRSIAYRGGAFHLLAQLALMKQLPASLTPAQVRCALWAVIEKTLIDPANYDENGWLRIGLNGHQPALGEPYISTGSLYLTSVIFLPLGLPDDDEFWTAPDEPWTQRKLWWLCKDLPADKAI